MADVFGRMVADYHDGELAEQPTYERCDGHEQPAHCAWYFSDPSSWPAVDREVLATVDGRVLDLGCGPGRAGRFLAERGHRVVGLDASPRAVAVARDRGLEESVVGAMEALPFGANALDCAVAVGSHVGAGGRDSFRSLLADLDRVLESEGRLVADCYDPTRVEATDLRSYLADRRLEPGCTTRRFRLRYDGAVGPWRTLLCCSPDALQRVVAPTSWRVATIRRCDGERTRYWFELERSG